MQPIEEERFKPNKIVVALLAEGRLDLNEIARREFSKEDRIQFAQLIGYSVYGFGELSYVDDDTYEAAESLMNAGGSTNEDTLGSEEKTRLALADEKLLDARLKLVQLAEVLFKNHPDDYEW